MPVPLVSTDPAGPANPARLLVPALVFVVLALVGVAWKWTPLASWLSLDALAGLGREIDAAPFTPLLVIGAYMLAGLLVLPLTVLIGVTGLVFGPWWGVVHAMTGALSSAALLYLIGRWIGRERVARYGGRRLNGASRRLARAGIVGMAVIRLVPFAPYSLINLAAGASQLAFHHYLIGTAIGLLPGMLLTTMFVDRLVQAVRDPGPGAIMLAVGLAVAVVGVGFVARRVLAGTSRPR